MDTGPRGFEQLQARIDAATARIAVMGLGYVGLPLAVGLAEVGFPVVGVDVDAGRVAAIGRGESYLRDVPSSKVAALRAEGRLSATADYEALRQVDVAFICVPTPYDRQRAPDLSYIRVAAAGIAERLQPGQLVILQSTTYPGTTEEEVQPILERSGLRAGRDFYLAFSPERINPGDRVHTVRNTPKVVGGVDPASAELAARLLRCLTAEVCVVSSARAAEMSKLLENVFRSVNIALVNELAVLCERMGIDIWEVIAAASTKPFGFMPFTPGPGVGGHCIPVDPCYLAWKAREYDFRTRFIELAAEVNEDMPRHVVGRVAEALNMLGKPLRGADVLLLGVTFKRDVDDARNSPAARIVELLLAAGARVSYNDPYAPVFRVGDDVFCRPALELHSEPLTLERVRAADCIVIVAGHSDYDYAWLVREAPLIIDTVNATRSLAGPHIVRLGAPVPEGLARGGRDRACEGKATVHPSLLDP
ncbi:MAG: nucleotide sugar dehydrogenase [Anaerolineae bacterium]|nr:nucleotide sugar dehydrogenase [Anaerolineae bacterium]